MMEVVVLGMHASGTSLVSHVLIKLGVHMGDRFLGPVRGKQVYEDGDFMRMNVRLLKAAGGNWGNPPPIRRIKASAEKDYFVKAIPQLIKKKRKSGAWGWKDPRNCVTIPAYAPHLINPYYITVYRDKRAVAKSILRRGPSAKNLHQWIKVTDSYNEAIREFLEEENPKHAFRVDFETITNRAKARAIVRELRDFLGLSGNVKDALDIIEYRKA